MHLQTTVQPQRSQHQRHCWPVRWSHWSLSSFQVILFLCFIFCVSILFVCLPFTVIVYISDCEEAYFMWYTQLDVSWIFHVFIYEWIFTQFCCCNLMMFTIGVNVWWTYLAPQNIPSAIVLTFGNTVVCIFSSFASIFYGHFSALSCVFFISAACAFCFYYHTTGAAALVFSGFCLSSVSKSIDVMQVIKASTKLAVQVLQTAPHALQLCERLICRFSAVRKKFNGELRELKLRDQTPYTAQSIISLLMGLKFFRVKVHEISVKSMALLLCCETGFVWSFKDLGKLRYLFARGWKIGKNGIFGNGFWKFWKFIVTVNICYAEEGFRRGKII